MNRRFGTGTARWKGPRSRRRNLCRVHGIGRPTATAICRQRGVLPSTPWQSVSPATRRLVEEWLAVQQKEASGDGYDDWDAPASGARAVTKDGRTVTGLQALHRRVRYGLRSARHFGEARRAALEADRQSRLWDQRVRTYRRKKGLPVRGQRTRSNAKTAKKFNAARVLPRVR